jgi:hypothetical protein
MIHDFSNERRIDPTWQVTQVGISSGF